MIVGPTFFSSPPSGGDQALLLHFNGDFVDSSPFARTVTVYGTPGYTSTYEKFDQAYSPSGTSWGETADDGTFDFGSDTFSVDFWLYIETAASLAVDNVVVGKWGAGNGSWFVNIYGPQERLNFGRRSAGVYNFDNLMPSRTLPRDSLMHVAIWKAPSTGDLFLAIDGIIETSVTLPAIDGTANDLGIGAVVGGGAALVPGIHVDELRIRRGAIDYDTSNFTPPTAPYLP